MSKKIVRDSIPNAVARIDGLINAFTSLGDSSRDKRSQTTYSRQIFNQLELANWYVGCDVFRRIVDVPIEEMTREGYRIFQDDEEITGDFCEWADQFCLDEKIEKAMKMAKLFGGAGLVLGLDDSPDNQNLKFNPKRFKKLQYVVVFDRFTLTSTNEIDKSPFSKNFLKPKKYLCAGANDLGGLTIDASRVVRCEGVEVPDYLLSNYAYWGDTALTALRDAISAYLTGNSSASYLLSETGRMVIKIDKLYEMLSRDGGNSNGAGTTALKARLAALEYGGSVINGFIMGEGEDASRAMLNLSGIPELLDKIKDRLSASTNIPHTILFNESPSGLGATGNSEMTHWYEFIKRKQECELRPILNSFVDLYFLEKMGKISKYSIKFNPLQLPSPSEIADVQTKRVTNIRGLIQDQVITPEVGLESLIDPDDAYSLDLEIDDSMMAALAAAEPEPMQEDIPAEGDKKPE